MLNLIMLKGYIFAKLSRYEEIKNLLTYINAVNSQQLKMAFYTNKPRLNSKGHN